MAELGVYVHFPYCSQHCPYCDFAVKVVPDVPHDSYADTVLAELRARAPRFPGRSLVSIYLGGGTPGLWRGDALARVLDGVRAAFPGQPREVTCEVNPEDVCAHGGEAQLAALAAAGVTRLSLGVQSLSARALVELGRQHDPTRARAAVATVRRLGFAELSLDLIYGLPGERPGELAATLAGIIELAPEHVSAYALTIEERTPFGQAARRGTLTPLGDGRMADAFDEVDRTLTGAGYQHYEVSNFARPGRRAVHNSRYWRGLEYLGLGCSAHSLRHLPGGRAERFASPRTVEAWTRGVAALVERPTEGDTLEGDPLLALHELLEPDALAWEALFLGLRTADGVPVASLARQDLVPELVKSGLALLQGQQLVPTARGMLVADEMALRLTEQGCTSPPGQP